MISPEVQPALLPLEDTPRSMQLQQALLPLEEPLSSPQMTMLQEIKVYLESRNLNSFPVFLMQVQTLLPCNQMR